MSTTAYCQKQDIQFHLNAHLLTGQKIIKVKRDFNDVYLWALGANNTIYRINSETLVVDDYTSKFTAYNNYQFIDIAGHSADTVFLVANTPNMFEYGNGSIKVFGSADGIPGNVNSVCEDIGWNLDNFSTKGEMRFATNNGMRMFKLDSQTIEIPPDRVPFANNGADADSKIYEGTYRNEVFKDSIGSDVSGWANDTLRYLPVTFNAGIGSFYTGYIYEDDNYFSSDINTVSVLPTRIYYTPDAYFSAYVWGSDNGLFENYWDYSYHYDGYSTHYLDHIKVNKVTNIIGLEGLNIGNLIKQNLLIGTDQGFYFSSSAYAYGEEYPVPFSLFHYDDLGDIVINDVNVNAEGVNDPICENGVWLGTNDGIYLLKPDYSEYISTKQNLINFQNKGSSVTQEQICQSSYINIVTNDRFPNILWYKNGNEIPLATKDTLKVTDAGDYNAVVYDPCSGIHVESDHLQVSVTTAPSFAFNYPDTLRYCASTPVNLQVTENRSFHYRWYTNGVLNGDTTSALNVTQNGQYNVEVSACTNSWVPTKVVNIVFSQVDVPMIAPDKPGYCNGDNATLSITQPANPTDQINWYLNNNIVNNYTNKTSIITNTAGNYTVTVTGAAKNTDGTICGQTSAPFVLTFEPKQTITITQTADNTLCDGQTVYLKANYNNGTIKWSTGQTTDQIAVTNTGKYSVTLQSSAGCFADTSVNITFSPNPVLHINDTTICTYKNETVVLTAPAGLAIYNWNGQNGGQFFSVRTPQTVNLTVTDSKGCNASTQISVLEQCPDIEIPNTFTPNGDGHNDYWDIQGLDNTADVKVFNRYGTQLYHSIGYSIHWDGTYKHSKLPSGTYYYIVKAKQGKQTYSGSVTIVY